MAASSSSSFGRGAAIGFLAGSSAFAGYFLAQRNRAKSASNDDSLVEADSAGQSNPPTVAVGAKFAPFKGDLKKVNLVQGGAATNPSNLRERWVRALERSNAFTKRQMEARARGEGRKQWDYNWDNRHPEVMVRPLRGEEISDEQLMERQEKVKKAAPKVTKRIILVRHGQYNQNTDKDEERTLTELGREQARMTGKRVAELMRLVRANAAVVGPDGQRREVRFRLVNSTMTRAAQTAEIVASQIAEGEVAETAADDMIREGAPVVPEPAVSAAVWSPEEHTFFEEGARIEAAFRKYVHRADPGQDVEEVDIIVCHGNVIRYFVCRALQFPPDAWLRFSVHNASITTLHVRPSGRVGLMTMGEAWHMPPEMLTFN